MSSTMFCNELCSGRGVREDEENITTFLMPIERNNDRCVSITKLIQGDFNELIKYRKRFGKIDGEMMESLSSHSVNTINFLPVLQIF